MTQTNNHKIKIWLIILSLFIVCMIIIGGFTRLSGSGLSMTKWRPISGIIPPITQEAWHVEFRSYKNSPEFNKVNFDMNLQEFKFIFYVEFIHRFMARITGFILLFGLIYFIYRKEIRKKDYLFYSIISILFLSQAIIGWYMVKSGLVDNPHVSHYRLALHLFMASLLLIILFNKIIKLHLDSKNITSKKIAFKEILCKKILYNKCLFRCLLILLILTILQIILGALVAGLNAGMIYNQFPLMGISFIPNEIYHVTSTVNNDINIVELVTELVNKYLNNPAIVQFFHRINAYIIFAITIFIYFKINIVIKHNDSKNNQIDNQINNKVSKINNALIFTMLIQVILGITTLIFYVPILLALLHQITAFIFIFVIIFYYRLLDSFCP